jgi:hypothetical protein
VNTKRTGDHFKKKCKGKQQRFLRQEDLEADEQLDMMAQKLACGGQQVIDDEVLSAAPPKPIAAPSNFKMVQTKPRKSLRNRLDEYLSKVGISREEHRQVVENEVRRIRSLYIKVNDNNGNANIDVDNAKSSLESRSSLLKI